MESEENLPKMNKLIKKAEALEKLRQEQSSTDVTMKCKGGNVHAHKIILMSSCNYFEVLLSTNMSEMNSGQIDFTPQSKDVIECMVKYLYTSQLPKLENHPYELVKELLKICHMMDLGELVNHCWEKMMQDLSLDMFAELWTYALIYDLSHTNNKFEEFVINHIQDLSENKSIQKLTASQLERLIEFINNKINCYYSCKCICTWTYNDEREEIGTELLQKIQLDHIHDAKICNLLLVNSGNEKKTIENVIKKEIVSRFYKKISIPMQAVQQPQTQSICNRLMYYGSPGLQQSMIQQHSMIQQQQPGMIQQQQHGMILQQQPGMIQQQQPGMIQQQQPGMIQQQQHGMIQQQQPGMIQQQQPGMIPQQQHGMIPQQQHGMIPQQQPGIIQRHSMIQQHYLH